MKQEMIWATEAGISLHVEMLEKSARFRIERGPETLAMAEIENWKFCRVIQILGGTAPQIRKEGKTPLRANMVLTNSKANAPAHIQGRSAAEDM